MPTKNCDNFVRRQQSHREPRCVRSSVRIYFFRVCSAFAADCVTCTFSSHASAFYSSGYLFCFCHTRLIWMRCVAKWSETLAKMKSSPQLYRRHGTYTETKCKILNLNDQCADWRPNWLAACGSCEFLNWLTDDDKDRNYPISDQHTIFTVSFDYYLLIDKVREYLNLAWSRAISQYVPIYRYESKFIQHLNIKSTRHPHHHLGVSRRNVECWCWHTERNQTDSHVSWPSRSIYYESAFDMTTLQTIYSYIVRWAMINAASLHRNDKLSSVCNNEPEPHIFFSYGRRSVMSK